MIKKRLDLVASINEFHAVKYGFNTDIVHNCGKHTEPKDIIWLSPITWAGDMYSPVAYHPLKCGSCGTVLEEIDFLKLLCFMRAIK